MTGLEATPDSHIHRQLITLGLFPLSELIAWSSIFPYIHAMVKSLGQSSDPDGRNTAFYASLLVSVFTFGEFLMAPQWARVSDRIGRKPTLLIGSVGAMFSATAFGFSSSVPMAIAARTFAGLVNPNVGVVDTYIGELALKDTPDNFDHPAQGFSTVAFMRGFGTISGPVIGGYLANPSTKLPAVFPPGSVWEKYPYLLPNLVVIICLAVSCTLGLVFLREAHPQLRNQEDILQRMLENLRSWAQAKRRGDGQGSYAPVLSENDIETGEDGEVQGPEIKLPKIDRRKAFTNQVLLQILSSTVLGFVVIANLALVPIFLGTEQPSTKPGGGRVLGGGFGLDTKDTSHILLTQAIASILYQIFVIPRLVKRVGTLKSYRLALALWTANYLVAPFSVLLPGFLGILAFMVSLWIHSLCGGIAGTCKSMMLTNTVPNRIYLATINGVATSSSCLARTAGPITVGGLFQAGISAGNVGVSFWTLAGVTSLSVLLSWTLKEQNEEDA